MEGTAAETAPVFACTISEVRIDSKKERMEPGITEEIVTGCHRFCFSLAPAQLALNGGISMEGPREHPTYTGQ